jgi:hypothetical protein
MLPAGGAVGLAKSLKDHLLLVWFNANAAIGNRKRNPPSSRRADQRHSGFIEDRSRAHGGLAESRQRPPRFPAQRLPDAQDAVADRQLGSIVIRRRFTPRREARLLLNN